MAKQVPAQRRLYYIKKSFNGPKYIYSTTKHTLGGGKKNQKQNETKKYDTNDHI